ncbi:hypothetical protein E2C01_070583 [Portunus trituberculatus]|uniref:Uncharacterized protein n=1 Tax=Portunus trituberculatus TaxID=210409 RepID=A0A5B7I3V4_PORTR|nr:hypothetical protein [Portunus trituberculatus]
MDMIRRITSSLCGCCAEVFLNTSKRESDNWCEDESSRVEEMEETATQPRHSTAICHLLEDRKFYLSEEVVQVYFYPSGTLEYPASALCKNLNPFSLKATWKGTGY